MRKEKSTITLVQIISILMGLVLLGFGGWWTFTYIKNVLELPDLAGHGPEYLLAVLFGIVVSIIGTGFIALSIFTLIFERLNGKIDTSSTRKLRSVLSYLVIVIGIPLFFFVIVLLLYLLVLKSFH